VINDYGGSDYSTCLVFSFAEQGTRVDVLEELRVKMGSDRSIFGNHHVYVECVGWVGNDKVKVKVSGYGDVDPDGFTRIYEHPIGGSFRLLKSTATFSRP
jgi:hypothetical protein